MDPLHLKEWFKRPHSIAITTLLIFFAVLYNVWLYTGKWLDTVLEEGLVPGDVTFIKALTFIFVLMITNMIYMVLSRQVNLSRTVHDQGKQLVLFERKFQNLIDNVPDVAVQGFDPNGTILYWNQASENMYGYLKEEAIGQKMVDILIPDENVNGFTDILYSIKDEREYKKAHETTFLAKNGQKIPVFSSYSAVPISDDCLEIFSMEVDLTERKRMEQDLKTAKGIAEDSSKAKSKFLASMSHELRTPLNSIIGFSEILGDDSFELSADDQKRYAQNIYTSGNHLLAIINDILDLSKAEAGKMELQYEHIMVPLVVNEVVGSMEASTSARNISIHTDIGPDVGMVEADPGKLKQILYNLIGNAVKFSHEEGNIIVRLNATDGIIRFEVEDDGAGIKEEDLDKLFQPFSQVGKPSTVKQKGTGLGLSLVKELVELHKGKVWVRSEYGKYSIFGFSIPQDRSQ